ncbi:DUF6489 family protein [Altericroceibacterium endophyticum]|uniref:Uncharacterized protein n=1 Tax=Altericroceibacterium endophyticum TaxID=1808508 RepID=A0A6I4T347_9SPHN|nr:DUF6489 family protein [Altericroceibacterium endophyticum]MXO65654.1 hypothetical protein [Altericroceibacterium endophyticum]
MKIHFEIDCTPEEARRFMGLPDVEQANKAYMDSMAQAMKGVSSVDQLQDYAAKLAPMGEFGLKMFQNFLESGAAFGDMKSAKGKPDGGTSPKSGGSKAG